MLFLGPVARDFHPAPPPQHTAELPRGSGPPLCSARTALISSFLLPREPWPRPCLPRELPLPVLPKGRGPGAWDPKCHSGGVTGGLLSWPPAGRASLSLPSTRPHSLKEAGSETAGIGTDFTTGRQAWTLVPRHLLWLSHSSHSSCPRATSVVSRVLPSDGCLRNGLLDWHLYI